MGEDTAKIPHGLQGHHHEVRTIYVDHTLVVDLYY